MERQWFPVFRKFKTWRSASEVLASVCWDRGGILLVDYMERGVAITAEYYVALLDKLNQ
jgi:hypothetical protein